MMRHSCAFSTVLDIVLHDWKLVCLIWVALVGELLSLVEPILVVDN